ncbi:MAB_1171c family putative transporter [Amycolatopsis cihanbeyliensis]|uniref:DUF6545 domain-containing protein n=1 Tax=Amycolatopsis cihanbeyliensis TaxID=1128664 RepID=A0A542DK19_AMYCI|nr:MAB_1171c family putative transporter [Amycolatopsis cihanbeyliensis]TQJ03426.1 hypothetical protein FB471_3182 [Amycolatopsis cihanbeyliensis]
MTIVQGVLLYAALLWKLYQLARAPRDRPLRMVTLCLGCAAVAYPIGLAGGNMTQPDAGPMPLMVAHWVLLLVMVYALICFFLFSVLEPAAAQRRARWQLLPLAAVLSALALAAVSTPSGSPPADYPVGTVAMFYLAVDLYLVYGLGSAFGWTRRYARGAEPRLARGLVLTSTGLALMVLGASLLVLVVAAFWAGGTVPGPVSPAVSFTVLPGILLFIVGVSYPGAATRLAALRVWWQHLRTYHQLNPLWTLFNGAFPEDSLSRMPVRRWRDLLSLRGVHRRYYRRAIECRDGLVRISPYLPAGAGASTETLAPRLRAALRAYRDGEAVPRRANPVALPAADGLDADVGELVTLAEALRAN